MIKRYLLLLVSLAGYYTASSQHIVTKAGSETWYRITKKANVGMTEASSTDVRIKVKAATDTSLLLNCTITDIRDTLNGSPFGTASREVNTYSSNSLQSLALVNQSFDYTFVPGKVPDQPGIAALFAKAADRWSLKTDNRQMMQNNARTSLLDVNMIFPNVPKPLRELPPSFISADSSTIYEVTERTGKTTTLQATSNPATARQGHTFRKLLTYDNNTGLLLSGTFHQDIKENKDFPLFITTSVQQITAKEARASSLNQDLVDAVIKASYYSQALRPGPEVDSTLLENYIAQYDPILSNNDQYNVGKLGLVQGAKMTDKYRRYDQLLQKVPNSALANSYSHLFNKAQALKELDADGTYDVLKYMSRNTRTYNDWIQNSFAQSFLPMLDTAEAQKSWKANGASDEEVRDLMHKVRNSRATATKLIAMLVNDKDTVLSREVLPLYLWSQVKTQVNDKAALMQTVAKLESVSDGGDRGNQHRYALLVYQELKKAGYHAEATQLLNNTIQRLEKRVKDSLDITRHLQQNMLAYTYKIKSDEATDPNTSLNYLAKAAYYSPKNNSEKAHNSFYDRVFLNSEESYRIAFSAALLKQGSTNEALKILSDQLTVDPGMLTELKQSFGQSAPDKDFYSFLHDVVIRNWKTVPTFALQSADGNSTFKLEDYKGKWLLIDFWGTWCAPCRQELPKVNKFAQSVKNSPDIAFLSVACHDRAEAVTTFMDQEKYTFDAAMSDNKIEKNYAVSGYPSKFLVSPSGHMLEIPFGKDWEGIVALFTAVKPKTATEKASLKQTKSL
ncbi:TlpA family protein disulfide reductase [Chitinophaga horti]|uniref:TlpA family protein disulfide reductase n=1 Tax=Chitinophaga horti TaxID=2920382 RepID=A0ABY6IYK3_9BACT|nr:TlpA disulfide reductase family protein [Chitinophaga horti]UYQ90992.1 TlpA family protein disulfide reductase [Chitinophaga horti]